MKNIFKSPFDWTKPEITYIDHSGTYEREIIKRIIKTNPEIFDKKNDIYLDEELSRLLTVSIRENRLNKLLNRIL